MAQPWPGDPVPWLWREGSVVSVPSVYAGFGGLNQGTPATWHLVADLQVPRLGRLGGTGQLGL